MVGTRKNVTLLERRYAKTETVLSQKRSLNRFGVAMVVLLMVAHQWTGFVVSIPVGCALIILVITWRLSVWVKARSPRRGEHRTWQRLCFGETITRMADGSIQARVRRSQLEFVRADQKDNGRKDFTAVLKDGTEHLVA